MKFSAFNIWLASLLAAMQGDHSAANPCDDDGEFTPDPEKYYTISNGHPSAKLYWKYTPPYLGLVEKYQKPLTPGGTVTWTVDPSEREAHWRFIEATDIGQAYYVQSRRSGFQLGLDKSTLNVVSVQPSYNQAQLATIDTGDQFMITDCDQTTGEPTIEGIRINSGAVFPLWKIDGSFDLSLQIEEVTEYTRLSGPDSPSTKVSLSGDGVLSFDGSSVVSALGTVLAAGFSSSCPLCGGAFSALTSMIVLGDDTSAVLEELAAEILDLVDTMINYEIATEELKNLIISQEDTWDWFSTTYLDEKHNQISQYDADDYDSNVDRLGDSYLKDFEDVIRTTFADVDDYTEEGDLYRAYLGFDYLKLSITQALTMRQEYILAKAFKKDVTDTCESYVETHLTNEGVLEEYRTLLQQVMTVIYQWKRQDVTYEMVFNSLPTSFRIYEESEDKYVLKNTELPETLDIFGAYMVELMNDLTYLSYNINDHLDYLDTFESETLEKCQALQNRDVRAIFATDDEMANATCSELNEGCWDDIDCCDESAECDTVLNEGFLTSICITQ